MSFSFPTTNSRQLARTQVPVVFLVSFLIFLLTCSAAEQVMAAPATLGARGDISHVKRLPATVKSIAAAIAAEAARETEPANPVKTPQRAIPAELSRITAHSAIIMDDSSARILFAKAPDDPRQPASTIKVLTGIIALKSLTGDESVPVSHEAASRPSSKMYLDPAKVYRADELISGVLLGSANDASVALAEILAGSEQEFAEYMTMQARHWGANHTVCKTATGLTAKDQASTARDLALIFREAMRNPDFARKMKTRSITTDEGNTLYNHNKALWRIPGAEGGKTGYTLAARQTYVGKFSNGEAAFIVAIMGSETMWNDLKQLVNYGFSQYPAVSSAPETMGSAGDLLAATGATETSGSAVANHN